MNTSTNIQMTLHQPEQVHNAISQAMTYSHAKQSKNVVLKQNEITSGALLMQSLAESSDAHSSGHSQDADRHHKTSHKKMHKVRGDLERSDYSCASVYRKLFDL